MRQDRRAVTTLVLALTFGGLSGCVSTGYVESNIPGLAAGLTATRDMFIHNPCRGDHVQLMVDVRASAEMENENMGFLGVRQRVEVDRDCVTREVRND